MNILYKKQLAAIALIGAVSAAAFGQKTKVRTITIVNGDTTVNESIDDMDIAKLQKEMSIMIDDDSAGGKKMMKKIVIKGDGDDTSTMAYAYGFGDDKDTDIDMSTGEDGSTKIVIHKGKDGKGDDKKGNAQRSSTFSSSRSSSGNSEKERLNVNIQVEKNVAKIAVESGSSSPMNVSILDENGKQVFYDSQKNGSSYKKEIPLDKKGTYFMNIIQDKRSTTDKIVVD